MERSESSAESGLPEEPELGNASVGKIEVWIIPVLWHRVFYLEEEMKWMYMLYWKK